MKNTMRIVFAFLILGLIFLYPFFAIGAEEKGEKGTISVTGTASGYYPPDVVIVTLSVETFSKTASEAVAQNSIKADKMVSTLKTFITPSLGDSIKTSFYSVRPVYEKMKVLSGYRVINQVTLRTKRTEEVGDLIDKAIEIGANVVQGIDFTIEDEKAFCDSILKKAIERAKREAEVVAQSTGMKITGIKNISPTCRKETHYPFQREMLMEAKISETPIEAGDIAINATVNVVFYIE